MPKFNVQVPHSLSTDEARERLDKFVDILRQKFQDSVSDLEQGWEGDTLRFKFKSYGIPLQGGIKLADKAFDVEGDIPFTAMMFKGKIESAIKEQLARLAGSNPAQPT